MNNPDSLQMWCRGLDVEWSVSRLMMLLLTRSSGWRQTEEQPLRISRRLLQTSNEKLTHTRTYTPPTFHLHRFFAVPRCAWNKKGAVRSCAPLSFTHRFLRSPPLEADRRRTMRLHTLVKLLHCLLLVLPDALRSQTGKIHAVHQ